MLSAGYVSIVFGSGSNTASIGESLKLVKRAIHSFLSIVNHVTYGPMRIYSLNINLRNSVAHLYIRSEQVSPG